MPDATSMEGEVDHELTSGGPVKRPGRPGDHDRTEDRDVDAVVHHSWGTVGGAGTWPRNGPQNPRGQAHCVGAEGFEPSLGTV